MISALENRGEINTKDVWMDAANLDCLESGRPGFKNSSLVCGSRSSVNVGIFQEAINFSAANKIPRAVDLNNDHEIKRNWIH